MTSRALADRCVEQDRSAIAASKFEGLTRADDEKNEQKDYPEQKAERPGLISDERAEQAEALKKTAFADKF